MFGSLLPLLVASAAVVGGLPSGSLFNGDDVLEKRSALDPISTDSPASIAGGEIACGSPPVSSFFASFKPPVRKSIQFLSRHPLNMDIVPDKHVVGALCGSPRKRHCRRPVPV